MTGPQSSSRRDALALFALALVVRAAVVLWAAGRFPPTADGRFYHVLAERIASGAGYTWLWPDGAVTPVAHYPVGYPALLALLYAPLGAHAWLGMALAAVLGAWAAVAVYRLAGTRASRSGALLAGVFAALHPALVPYSAALMTEGVAGSLLVIAAWLAVASRPRRAVWRLLTLGATFGVITLVRPQCLLLAPLFGAVAWPEWRLKGAVLAGAVAAACVLPWTARNCVRMDRCAVVSANAGWNLWIGAAPHATGTFVPIEGETVPAACREVFGEVDKDVCFGRAARAAIAEHPLRWLSLVPAKLRYTFEYAGAAGWYLHAANPAAFPERAKLALGVVESLFQRALVALALIALARTEGPRRRFRAGLAALAGLALLTPMAWLAYLGLVGAAALLGRRLVDHPPAVFAASTVLLLSVTHAVFFGAGRYSLLAFAMIAALAGCLLTPGPATGDTSPSEDPSRCP